MPAVSVIVPVYKVENYVAQCIHSLMAQTLNDVEFVFVDDGSPDRSIDIIREIVDSYPGRREAVKYVVHDVNCGLPAARNSGLRCATGDYILHFDSDDYAEPQMLATLYDCARATGADYVWCDWFLTFTHNERPMQQPCFENPDDALRAMLSGTLRHNVWNKLVHRSVYERSGIRFPEGHSMGEDMTMIRLCACASATAKAGHSSLYHYRSHTPGSLTAQFSEKNLSDTHHNTCATCDFVLKHKGKAFAEAINHFKLEVKRPLLFSDANPKACHRLWKEWFPEANGFIMTNSNKALRVRLLELAASKGMFFLVDLYRTTVFRLFYGLIYR